MARLGGILVTLFESICRFHNWTWCDGRRGCEYRGNNRASSLSLSDEMGIVLSQAKRSGHHRVLLFGCWPVPYHVFQ